MFSTEAQQAQVCERLGALIGQPGWWRRDGPTRKAVDLFTRKGGTLSSGERLMLLAAFDIWNGRGEMSLGQALAILDGPRLEALGSLLVALASTNGGAAVEAWLQAHPAAAGEE